MVVRNWSYGCSAPLNWGPDVDAQLEKQVLLWNRLLDIEDENRAEYRRVVGTDESVSQLEQRIDALVDQLQATKERRAARRKASRSKTPGDDDSLISDLSKQIRALRDEAKIKRKEARTALEKPLTDLETSRRVAVVTARQKAAEDGLWWGNYNAVIASFDTARSRALKTGASLRRQHFDGTGRLTVQVQGGMSSEELHAGERSEVRVSPRPRGDGKPTRWWLLTITAYANGRALRRTVEVPILLHRPFPNGAVIKSVTLVRRRLAPGRLEYKAVFSIAIPDESMARLPGTGRKAGIDIGWRSLPNGLRVAVLADDAGNVESAYIPPEVIKKLDYCEELQSDIDDDLNAYWTSALAYDWRTAPDCMADALESMRRARRPHPRHLVKLTSAWPDEYEPDRKAEMLAWLRRDLRERRRLVQTREKALLRRKHWMRETVAGWLRKYDHLIIDGHDLRNSMVKETPNGQDSTLTTVIRQQQRIAAPGELRAWLFDAGQSKGRKVEAHNGRSTWDCHHCGTEHKPSDPAQLIHRCRSCGTTWDQDINAAKNLLSNIAD